MSKLKIFLTGGSGMVGCNLLDHPDIKQQFKIISPRRQELDLLNFYAVKSYLEKNRPDMIELEHPPGLQHT